MLFLMLNVLHFYISTFRSMCAVRNMAVFCSSLISCFTSMLLRYFQNYFEMVPVDRIIVGITFVFTFNMRCIYIARSLYFRVFSAHFLIIFLSPKIATSINIRAHCALPRIMMSCLLLGMILSVCACRSCNIVTLPSWLVLLILYTLIPAFFV
jgi:hypothetical protein